jgi:hypothetical protein
LGGELCSHRGIDGSLLLCSFLLRPKRGSVGSILLIDGGLLLSSGGLALLSVRHSTGGADDDSGGGGDTQ